MGRLASGWAIRVYSQLRLLSLGTDGVSLQHRQLRLRGSSCSDIMVQWKISTGDYVVIQPRVHPRSPPLQLDPQPSTRICALGAIRIPRPPQNQHFENGHL